MKVVLFCGGLGTRIREYPEPVPKPMITIGYRPILWHVMKYYAHYGHTDFILCLGYRADVVKNYFLHYDECTSNDFVLSHGGKKVQLLHSDIDDWNITFVDTGIQACVGQRLKAVEPYLEGEPVFLANYSDGLTDLPLDLYLDHFLARDRIGAFLAVPPPYSSHIVSFQDDVVESVQPIHSSGLWINGGFFAFRRAIFDYLEPGEELVEQPFERLIAAGQLLGYKYRGYWTCMDTFKDRQILEELWNRGNAPWEVWKRPRLAAAINGR
ncbi:MAG: glucose-1-phosphate cytidylyltransferase [Isosphaeraceae bacterium]|jgi:glucose-1-phosphate cytidylyltransferase|nr:MAG: glucose-1-phosphate cytidylyltransferase [Isosphaeraceae bacterium]